ncbi:anti-sigma factor [Pigmentiphaga soli]|uniref:Anti-sigma factor n=1 Tax=Pigmentiphaga soli TaxID=1007095 RepID=A0ABP8GGY3_9BURK
MNESEPTSSGLFATGAPIAEADLHAYADRELPPARRAEVEAYLASHPDARRRIEAWQAQKRVLREWLDPVLDDPLPLRFPLQPARRPWPWPQPWRSLAAGVAIAIASGGAAWSVRGVLDARAPVGGMQALAAADAGAGFAHRAAIAHAVYTPEVRRPVEVGGDQEQALATWLTRRLGATVKPPRLAGIGYDLVGGRLLPGGKGPVAQFMYADANGRRLTLYVTREVEGAQTTAFRFKEEGAVKVFYWIDPHFGYALSGAIDRGELLRVSEEVYKQLD